MKPIILSGLTRNGCFQKEVSGFLEALQFLRKCWKQQKYVVGARLYGVKDDVIYMDQYINRPRPVVIIEEVELSDELPF